MIAFNLRSSLATLLIVIGLPIGAEETTPAKNPEGIIEPATTTSPVERLASDEFEIKRQEALADQDMQRELDAYQHLSEILNSFFGGANTPAAVGTRNNGYAGSGGQGWPVGTPRDYSSGECGYVKIDCGSHKIYFSKIALDPIDQVIDCGRPGLTLNGLGKVGGITHGNVVKTGVDMSVRGMGTPGGGKWFHTPWWRPGQQPTGTNSSKGCIHVNPAVMNKLMSCEGADMEILNATNGGSNPIPFDDSGDGPQPNTSN
jgi:hypothetical protein